MAESDWLAVVADHKQRQALQIGRAAAELALRDGLSAVTMIGLAKAAGVSRATLYNYVPDVATAIRLYLRMQGEAFHAHVEMAIADESGAEAKLRRYVGEQVAFVASPDHRAAAALMDAGLRSQTGVHQDPGPDLLREILSKGIEEGIFAGDADPGVMSLLITRVLYCAHELLEMKQMSESDVRETLMSLIFNGIRK